MYGYFLELYVVNESPLYEIGPAQKYMVSIVDNDGLAL